MKKVIEGIGAGVLVASVVGLVFWVGLPDPLTELEQATRAMPVLATTYNPPTDNFFIEANQALQNTVVIVMGVSLTYEDLTAKSLAGFVKLGGNAPRLIHLDRTLGQTAQLETLAHEAAHLMQPRVFAAHSSDEEVFAEAVSFLVCRRFGHDDLDAAARYLALHKGGLHVLKDYRLEITYAAAVLSGGAK